MSRAIPVLLGIILVFMIDSLQVSNAAATLKGKQKICVIGAGAAGLATTRRFAEKSDLYDVVTFELKSELGGQWVYSDNIEPDEYGIPAQSSVYKNLRTNFPKQIMSYQDYVKPEGRESGYVTHQEFLQYLKDYAEHFDLNKYIQLRTYVERVTPIPGNGDWRTTKWKVETRNLNHNVTKETICNYVMVCNGRDNTPRIPALPGIESFPGKVLHSHLYRVPEEFAGKKVVVLGAGASGADITLEVSKYADTVYLSHNQPNKIESDFADNAIQVAGVVGAEGKELILKDGSRLEADALILCTGYIYDFPFLDESSGIKVENNYVQFIYKHIVNVEYPTMAFIGMPYVISVYPLYYTQLTFYMKLMEGELQLPSKSEMLKDCELKEGVPQHHAHRYNEETQWHYDKELANIGNFEPSPSWYVKGTIFMMRYIWTHFSTFRENICRFNDNGDPVVVPLKEL